MSGCKPWLDLYEPTLERLDVDVLTACDPTAAAPEFAIGGPGDLTPSGSFFAGTWVSPWRRGRATARTPLLGDGGVFTLTSGQHYRLWVKMTAGGRTGIMAAGVIRVP